LSNSCSTEFQVKGRGESYVRSKVVATAAGETRNLFVPFFTTKSDGTGLGLAYAQRVINEHGGRIDCATAPGLGSTFSVQLPLAVQSMT